MGFKEIGFMNKLIYFMLGIMLCPYLLYAGEKWDATDKALFATLAATMVADGITTHKAIQNGHYAVNQTMPDSPKGTTIAAHMIGQTIIQYFIADFLPEELDFKWLPIKLYPRKMFLSTAIVFRAVCSYHNLQITHSY
jgi:hypothetical protein